MSIADEVRAGNSQGPSPEGHRDSGFDRTPPQDIAAEQSVLGGMLLSKDAIADVVEILRSADFYRPAHATIFDTVVTTALDGAPQRVIRTSLIDDLEGSHAVTRLPKALRNALAFRKITGTSLRDLASEGLAKRKSQDLTRTQRAMAARLRRAA